MVDAERADNRLTNDRKEINGGVRRAGRPALESCDTGARCQPVDFRHAFLELRSDRIREATSRALAHQLRPGGQSRECFFADSQKSVASATQ